MNARRRAFCEHYAAGLSAAEAARRAGYAARSARSQGQRLLTKADIRDYVEELQRQATSERIADAQEVRERFTSILRDDEQRPAARLRAGEALLRYSPQEDASGPAPVDEESPEDGGGYAVIALPWKPGGRYAPTHYEGDDGTIQPLLYPGDDLRLILSRSQIETLLDKYHYHGEEEEER